MKRPRVWVVVCKGSKPREFRRFAYAYRAVAVRHQKDLDKDVAPCGPHSVCRLTQGRK